MGNFVSEDRHHESLHPSPIPPQEIIKPTPENVCWCRMDLAAEPTTEVYPRGICDADMELFLKNLQLARMLRIFEALITPESKEITDILFPVFEPDAQSQLGALKTAAQNHLHHVHSQSLDCGLRTQNSRLPVTTIEAATAQISRLQPDHQPYVIVSNTHAIDLSVLQACLRDNNLQPATTAVVIFDTHFDINDPQHKKPNVNVKSTAARDILDLGIGHALFLGVENEQLTELTTGHVRIGPTQYVNIKTLLTRYRRENNLSQIAILNLERTVGKAAYIARLGNRFGAIPVQQLNRAPSINKKTRLLRQHFAHMKKKGITNVFVSVDIDCLDLYGGGFTATEYSPFARLVSFGLEDYSNALGIPLLEFITSLARFIDLDSIINQHSAINPEDNPIRTIEKTYRRLFPENGRRLQKTTRPKQYSRHRISDSRTMKKYNREYRFLFQKLTTSFNNILYNINTVKRTDYPNYRNYRKHGRHGIVHSMPRGGIPANSLKGYLHVISELAREFDINIGLQLLSGATIKGTISELYGVDVGGRSTRIVKELAEILLNM